VRFYSMHVEGIGGLKSHSVLREVWG
jgi:hypothetical protein